MKITVDESIFIARFEEMGRGENFSYAGKRALFEFLEQLEEDTGEEMELDVIALCCDFTEYENLEEFREEYGEEFRTLEDIEEQTTVIPVGEESFIIQVF